MNNSSWKEKISRDFSSGISCLNHPSKNKQDLNLSINTLKYRSNNYLSDIFCLKKNKDNINLHKIINKNLKKKISFFGGNKKKNLIA